MNTLGFVCCTRFSTKLSDGDGLVDNAEATENERLYILSFNKHSEDTLDLVSCTRCSTKFNDGDLHAIAQGKNH